MVRSHKTGISTTSFADYHDTFSVAYRMLYKADITYINVVFFIRLRWIACKTLNNVQYSYN